MVLTDSKVAVVAEEVITHEGAWMDAKGHVYAECRVITTVEIDGIEYCGEAVVKVPLKQTAKGRAQAE